MKLLEVHMEENLHSLGIVKDFFNRIKSMDHERKKKDKFDFSKF